MPRLLLVLLLPALVAPLASAACCTGMTMSPTGLQLTEHFEGYVDHLYYDSAGNPTVCYGHLVLPGQSFPGTIPQSECQQLLQQDMGSAESCVQNNVGVNLNQDQFDALTDFVYNLGCGTLQSSTLLGELNQGNYGAVPGQMALFDHANGQVLPGLQTRRAAEGQLWSGNPPSYGPVGPGSSGGATANPNEGVGDSCGSSGSCINVDVSQCSGTIQHDLCPGGNNILCCESGSPATANPNQGVGDSCGSSGSCINTDVSQCAGTIQQGLCPGGDNILCCESAPATADTNEGVGDACGSSGSCINTDTSNCDGTLQYDLCPGGDNIVCCEPTATTPAPAVDPNSGGGGGGGGNSGGGYDDDDYYELYARETNKKLDESQVIGITAGLIAGAVLVMGVATILVLRRRNARHEAHDLPLRDRLILPDDMDMTHSTAATSAYSSY